MSDSSAETVSPATRRRMQIRLFGICGTLIALGVAWAAATSSPASPVSLGDASEAHMVEIRDAAGQTVLAGEFRTRTDALGNVEKDAALFDRGGRSAVGEIEVELPPAHRSDRRPELEVDVMGLPPRQSFVIVIDDRAVGTFVTDDRGSVDMELQEGEIPSARDGGV